MTAILWLLALLQAAPQPDDAIQIDVQRLGRRFEQLSRFGETGDGGLERLAFSAQDRAARQWLVPHLTAAGADVRTDAAGNLIGRLAGSEPGLAAIAFGSHIDSVPEGGRFDGNAGVVAALEVVEALAAHGYSPRHSLEFVVFADEESSMVGSRTWGGSVTEAVLDEPTHAGLTVGSGMKAIGGAPGKLETARRQPGSLLAFLELHIEQGAVLDSAGVDIGVVEGIVGIKWWDVVVKGEANHAGTTPMDRRKDALLAAAEFVETVNRVALATPGSHVATVGRLEVAGGAPNVVPGEVRMSLELRDLDMGKVDRLFEAIRAESTSIAASSGTRFRFQLLDATARPAPTDAGLQELIGRQADRLGLSRRRMPSGAGHDAQNVAAVAPIGMIFVPSRNGVSHSPREFTSLEQLANGTRVLLGVILTLDAANSE